MLNTSIHLIHLFFQHTLNFFTTTTFSINSALGYLDPALTYVSPKFNFTLLFNRTDYMHLYAHNKHVRLVGSSLMRTLSTYHMHGWCFATYPQDTLHKLVYLTDGLIITNFKLLQTYNVSDVLHINSIRLNLMSHIYFSDILYNFDLEGLSRNNIRRGDLVDITQNLFQLKHSVSRNIILVRPPLY